VGWQVSAYVGYPSVFRIPQKALEAKKRQSAKAQDEMIWSGRQTAYHSGMNLEAKIGNCAARKICHEEGKLLKVRLRQISLSEPTT